MEYLGHDLLELDGGCTSFDDGYPDLPGLPYALVIPQGTSLADVEVRILERVEMEGHYSIAPVMTTIVGEPPALFSDHLAVEYLLDAPFPAEPVIGLSTGSKAGFRVAGFTFVPFSYHPLSGRLSVITSAELVLRYEHDPAAVPAAVSVLQRNVATESLETWIHNPGMLEAWSPPTRPDGPDDTTWLVVAPAAYEPFLQPLVDHRSDEGLSADFVPLEWIQSSYAGWDSPEKIRNYLKESFLERGLVYVLIVGEDEETVRISKYVDGYTLDETADLYFSDLDGTWDANGNHRYGEADDSLDYYSDIYVGRFPASDRFDVSVMVEKTLGYETDPPEGEWRSRALLCGALLFPDHSYHGDRLCDSLLQYIPPDWDVDVLLEDPHGWNPENQIELFNDGVAFVEPVGHGSTSGIWWMLPDWELMFGTDQIPEMANGEMLSLWQSISCYPGALLCEDCFGEWLMRWQSGGAVAVRFNSSVGRANPPNFGPNEYLDIYFAEDLLVEGLCRLGVPHATSKDRLYPTSVPKRLFSIQELNLLADPYLLFITGQTGIEPEAGQGGTQPGTVLRVYPNPTSGACEIAASGGAGISACTSVRIYDMSGRLLLEKTMGPAQDSVQLAATELPTGCYDVVLVGGSGIEASTRMVIIR
ncbi:T9SS type A sorting domain-containing protein [Candidatus Fermentibacterales bacterium]|nr:T9SS type A sorting domain-containing protein [Candidatus Fermentibacterales bacterium]